jgi:anti-sigma regulatory factor (Ser/Thr protein kinase)
MPDTRTFPLQSHSVALARRFVPGALREVATDHGAADLLVGELATNAVKHADSPFSVSVDVRAGVVRIEVVNDAPELVAAVNMEPSEAGGFGLRLVDALSQHWGTESTGAKKVVWFELARS